VRKTTFPSRRRFYGCTGLHYEQLGRTRGTTSLSADAIRHVDFGASVSPG
jgi:hypothetical protein